MLPGVRVSYQQRVKSFVEAILGELAEFEAERAQKVVDAVLLAAMRFISQQVSDYWTDAQLAYALSKASGEAIASITLTHIEDHEDDATDDLEAFTAIAAHCYALFRKEFQKVEP